MSCVHTPRGQGIKLATASAGLASNQPNMSDWLLLIPVALAASLVAAGAGTSWVVDGLPTKIFVRLIEGILPGFGVWFLVR